MLAFREQVIHILHCVLSLLIVYLSLILLASEWFMFLTLFLCLLTTLADQQVGGLLCLKPANNFCP